MAGLLLTPSPTSTLNLILSFTFIFLISTSRVSAHPHEHKVIRQLPSETWHHSSRSPLHSLFKRDAAASFPAVGSPTWLAAYPTGTPDATKTPVEWTNALNAAVAAGKIPNIPPTTLVNGYPTYPNNLNQLDPAICSATGKCMASGDVWNAPDGSIGIGFDDGPVAFNNPSTTLYNFLKSQNPPQIATHFMIGIAIYQAPTVFLEAFNNGDDIAVHTYTHPYMTTLSNADVLAQLGWTMQIIYDSTGGRIPKFWRPPSGNMDNRIRAIASEVFGLTPIMWNRDSEDWTMTSPGGETPAELAANLTLWINGPKSPGLIILEHELTNDTVTGFINAYPQMLAQKWKTTSVARLVPASSGDGVTGQVYWNASPGNKGTPKTGSILDDGKFPDTSSNAILPTSTVAAISASLTTPSSLYSSTAAPNSSSPPSPTPTPTTQSKTGDALRSGSISIVGLVLCVLWTILLS